jgi:hypothetical protein
MPDPIDSTNNSPSQFTALRDEIRSGFATVDTRIGTLDRNTQVGFESVGQDMRAGFGEASRQMTELIGVVREVHETVRAASTALLEHNQRIARLEARVDALEGRSVLSWLRGAR